MTAGPMFRVLSDEKEDTTMARYIIFDKGGLKPDRYTIIDRSSGDVFAACEPGAEAGIAGRFCGNCADHRVPLFGAGWRQMPLCQRIIDAEVNNYVRNAQLDPHWLGKELPQQYWPLSLLTYIDVLDKMAGDEHRRVSRMPYIGPGKEGT